MEKKTYRKPRTREINMVEKVALLASSGITNGTDPISYNPGGGNQFLGR